MARLFGGSGRVRVTHADRLIDRNIAGARRRAALPKGIAGEEVEITRMAELMAERQAANDNCTIEDLKGAGFSEADIARLGDRAKARARRLTRDLRIA